MAQLLRRINSGYWPFISYGVQPDSTNGLTILVLSEHLRLNPCVTLFAASKLAKKFTRQGVIGGRERPGGRSCPSLSA